MYCRNCGKMIPDGVKFCSGCGARTPYGEKTQNVVNGTIRSTENEFQNIGNNLQNGFTNNGQYVPMYQIQRLQTDRSLSMYIVLTLVTFGIYGFYFFHQMAHDVNVACQDDGEETPGLGMYMFLSIITCGIYQFVWLYQVGNRLAANAYKYGLSFPEDGGLILIWSTLGVFLCGVGPFVGMNILIRNTNLICQGYNRVYNLG